MSQGRACRQALEALKRELNAKGIKIRPDGYVETGTPDVLGSVPPGRAFALERKRPDEEITPLQEKRLREWAAAGAITGVFTTADEAVALVREALGR